ncbi:MAG: class I SAM-dependent methyltransferase [Pseudomonadales bacterium]|nr:class I SAM-dependent methyltransferase [Pseudomonadales bacterium]
MDQSYKFWDRIAERYAKQPINDEDSYQKKLAITQQYLAPSMNVLEFGCGTGSTALLHAPHVKHYLGIDISPKMIEISQSKLSQSNLNNIDFEVTTLDNLNAAKETYDAILGLSILHLLEDRNKAIEKVYELLKPGGVFVSNTACLGDSMGYFRYIAPIGKFFGLIPLVKVFTRSQLETSLETVGFSIERRWVPESSKLVYFIVARKPMD